MTHPSFPNLTGTDGSRQRLGSRPPFMNETPRLRFAALLFALASGVLLPALGFGGLAAWQVVQGRQVAAEERLRDTARALSLAADREIVSIASTLNAFATSPAFGLAPPGTLDLPALYAQAERVAAGLGAPVEITQADGAQLLNTLRPLGSALPPSPTDSVAATAHALATGEAAVSDLLVGNTPGQRTFAVVTPVLDAAGRPVLAAGSLPRAERMRDLLAAQGLPSGSFAAVTDARNAVVARSDAPHGSPEGKPIPPESTGQFKSAVGGLYRATALDEGV